MPVAAIVAGRAFSCERSKAEWRALVEQLDLVGLTIILQTDFHHAPEREPLELQAIVGLKIASTDAPSPTAVSRTALEMDLQRAGYLDWQNVEELIGETLSERTQVWAVSTGPLAGVFFAFGVPAQDESELLEWSAGSPQSRMPSLEFIAGKDTDQRRVSEGVWGLRLLYAGDWTAEPIDVSEAAHVRRVAALGVLGDEATYFLMACFD